MSILVHDSNKAACRAAAAALQQGCRAALVRPAGTGKGRIVWEMLAEQPDTRVLWVASCAARLELRRGLAKELGKTLDGSVRLMDCEQLAAQSALGWVALAEFRPGLLVLDGWREMSARDWTDCVQLLFRLCPEAKVLALAEPDAPGESCRAAEELLGDAVVEPLTLGGALADGLLPMPTSYTALLWPQEAAMARLRAEVKNLRVPGTPDPNAEKISGTEPCCGAAALRGSAAGAVAPPMPPGGISSSARMPRRRRRWPSRPKRCLVRGCISAAPMRFPAMQSPS